ncbi:hypothetical protein BLOT_005549 [Blomia tropicalis]|nr:hypothetical protein BLOT_005549 [Blomia tropicalis]
MKNNPGHTNCGQSFQTRCCLHQNIPLLSKRVILPVLITLERNTIPTANIPPPTTNEHQQAVAASKKHICQLFILDSKIHYHTTFILEHI